MLFHPHSSAFISDLTNDCYYFLRLAVKSMPCFCIINPRISCSSLDYMFEQFVNNFDIKQTRANKGQTLYLIKIV